METNLYTIRDRIAEECGPLFSAKNDEVASRSMVQLMVKVAAYDRSSYELLCVGTFDTSKGYIFGGSVRVLDYDMPKIGDDPNQMSLTLEDSE